MKNIIKKRMFSFPLILAGIIVINFILFHLSPGDPTNAYFDPRVKPDTYDVLRTKMGLDDPWYQQLYHWTCNAASGDFGYSWSHHRPVSQVLKEALPATLLLAAVALFLNMLLGCLLGLIAGVMSGRLVGKILNVLALLFYAVPTFWLAILLIYIFSSHLHVLPPSGLRSLAFQESTWIESLPDMLRHLILPAAVLGLVGAAATFQFIRANISSVMKENYITFAIAKGLSPGRVFFKHALKNSLIPVVTLLGLYLPALLGGAFVIEVIFAWPGVGRITYDAIFAKDFPVLMAVNFIIAILVLVGNSMADVLYQVVDPRIRID